jgi:carbon-monoxide dehydrogenase large subunit
VFGARVKRIEDPALLRGAGRFADDIRFPDLLHACFVRSPYAHAHIRSIDASAARAMAGVHAVYSFADLAPHLARTRIPCHMPSGAIRHVIEPEVLASEEVCHVGEPVAVVIADDRYAAEDAAELVAVDYEPLAAVIDARDALAADSAKARLDVADNRVAAFTQEFGDCTAAFRDAATAIHERFRLHKGGGHAIECRGVVARHEPADDVLTVWDGTQMPHRAHGILVAMLGCAEGQVRVVPPDVGGGFGPKFVFYQEEVVVPLAAKLLGRPVKWIEDRRESFVASVQERDQYWDVELAVDGDGRLLGLRGGMIHDHGAYTPYGIIIAQNAATNLLGPYVLPACSFTVTSALTNIVPAAPTRGAGRPQATFVMERLLDRAAQTLGLDRAEIRRRNMIAAEDMPWTTPVRTRDGSVMTYDSGDYPACQQAALDAIDWDGFAARQTAARARGDYIGVGLANYVEGTGRGPFEHASVRVGPSGKVAIQTGAAAQGQGSKTSLAQICAGILGIDIADISVVAGDTAASPVGLGAFASRQAVTAGSSVHQAAHRVREKALQAASNLLEAAEADLEIVDGAVRVKGAPDMSIGLGEIARALAGMPGYAMPAGMTPGLSADAHFEPATLTYCNGCHAAEVAVDVETGQVRILRYVVVHDSGRLINPMIVEGQIQGGVVHGIGSALYEWMKFDGDGQPQTMNFGEYLLPAAPETPRIEIHHMESPTPLNPLGVKGAGESGTIPAAAAIISAIEDALAPFGVKITETPLTPDRIVSLVAAGNASRGSLHD